MVNAEIAILVCTLLLIVAKPQHLSKALDPFLLEEYFDGTYINKNFPGRWNSGNTFIYNNDGIYSFDVTTNEPTLLVNSSVLEEYKGSDYALSKDAKYLLIAYDPISIFRHSTTARYVIYDIDASNYYDVAEKNQLSLVEWSPVGNAFVYVLNNNVYYQRSPMEEAIQLTTDGEPGIIYNGVPDWVYEEEVLGSGSAVWFSPDGTKLAIISFDDTEVKEASYFLYGQPGSMDDQYSTPVVIKYPKVGTTNPAVQLKTIDLMALENIVWTNLAAPTNVVGEDHVIFTVTWATSNIVAPVWTNRVQNLAVLLSCDATTAECSELKQLDESNGWLDLWEPVFNAAGSEFLWIVSQPEDNDSYKHLVRYQIDGNVVQETRLTSGKKEITSIIGWDEGNDAIYISGSFDNEPTEQHVYKVTGTDAETVCISCAIEQPEGICKSASASLSGDYTYMAISCTGPGPTIASIKSTTDLLGPDVLVWEANELLRLQMATKLQPKVKDITSTVSLDRYNARIRLLLPPDLDENDPNTKYPMIVNVYGGPNSNQISDRFSLGYQSYLITNRNVIYAYIDGRGSGRKGENTMFQIYRNLGTVEIEDQINITKELQDAYPWIDAERTAIWGWSYGGYATSMVLAKDTLDVFKCGISVAPVSSWIYYDSIYTERYMGLPTEEDNLAGYNGTDVTRRVEGIRGKEFLLIHGNADDNVHYQQAMALARALEVADIPFLQQSYPDENHSLRGVTRHLYHTMDEFWTNCLRLGPPAERNE